MFTTALAGREGKLSDLIRLTIKRNERYRIIYLEATEDPQLSWRAKGLHTYLISRPPDWKIRYKDLQSRATDGKTALASAIKELQDAGYLKIEKLQDEQGHFVGSRWIITESVSGLPIDNQPYPDFPDTGNPETGSPDTGNRGSNNEQVSKKKHFNNQHIRSAKPIDNLNRQADEVIDYLNEKTGSRFRHSEASRRPIRARLKEGVTVAELKLIIDHKAAQWIGTEFEQYLTPETLFRPTKFERNLNAAIKWEEAGRPVLRSDPKSKLMEDLAAAREFARAGNG